MTALEQNDVTTKKRSFDENIAMWCDPVRLGASPMCSACGGSAAFKTRLCPHCGARMENFVVEQVQYV